jgi:hypothetical protein
MMLANSDSGNLAEMRERDASRRGEILAFDVPFLRLRGKVPKAEGGAVDSQDFEAIGQIAKQLHRRFRRQQKVLIDLPGQGEQAIHEALQVGFHALFDHIVDATEARLGHQLTGLPHDLEIAATGQ